MRALNKSKITESELSALLEGAILIEKDGYGPKVYELPEKRMLKLFRVRRRLSSNLWSPYSKRFARNSVRAAQCAIPCVQCLRRGSIPHLKRQFVIYEKLAGTALRDCSEINPQQLGQFFANLHHQGIYFRSCHLGNILLLDNGELGLIDVADLKLRRRPLSKNERDRNFRHLRRVACDRDRLDSVWGAFMLSYDSHSLI
jgi:hypothetical protein